MNLRIHRLATDEIDREVAFYNSISTGLGFELRAVVDDALTMILEVPHVGPPSRHVAGCRTFGLSRFPFTLPYRVQYLFEQIDHEVRRSAHRPTVLRANEVSARAQPARCLSSVASPSSAQRCM